MRHVDWTNVEEAADFQNPAPGGYIVRIWDVDDVENKEYLRIDWEFADGPFKGENQKTYDRAGFWPYPLFQSYKEKSLGYFKRFVTAVEKSNPGYRFNDQNLMELRGKWLGVILCEEEYIDKSGNLKTRLKCDSCRSAQAIKAGDFVVPDKKPLKQGDAFASLESKVNDTWGSDDSDGELPFF